VDPVEPERPKPQVHKSDDPDRHVAVALRFRARLSIFRQPDLALVPTVVLLAFEYAKILTFTRNKRPRVAVSRGRELVLTDNALQAAQMRRACSGLVLDREDVAMVLPKHVG